MAVSTHEVLSQLRSSGSRLVRWEAERRGLFWGGVVFGLLCLLTLADLTFRFERGGRVAAWAVLLAALGALLALVARAFARRPTPESVAVTVERRFPTLDNHLINYVQFSEVSPPDAIQRAYIEAGIPGWEGINWGALRDRRALLKALGAAAGGLLVLLVPLLWTGPAWSNAMLRVINPFSARAPGTLARIAAVRPGDVEVQRGESVLLAMTGEGRPGQPVAIELRPSDDRKKTVEIGRLTGKGEQEFAHRMAAVTADVEYRFLAGDTYSGTYRVRALPPLAFSRVEATVTPPAYTARPRKDYDVSQVAPEIPRGSQLALRFAVNRPVREARLVSGEGEGLPFARQGAEEWKVALTMTSDVPLRVVAKDSGGRTATYEVRTRYVPDAPPSLRVLSPQGRPLLPLDGAPRIQWEAADDYGVASVSLEWIPDEKKPEQAQAVTNWAGQDLRELSGRWVGDATMFAECRGPLLFRLAAVDGAAGEPNRTVSPIIRFDRPVSIEEAKKERLPEAQAGDRLRELVQIQRTNLDRTRGLAAQAQAPAEEWRPVRNAQQQVRDLAGALLADPQRPLGTQANVMRDLHQGDMFEAVRVLDRTGAAPVDQRPVLARQAVEIESRILRALTQAGDDVGRVEQHKRITGLLALIEALVNGQEETLAGTRKCTESKAQVGRLLVERQDRLAEDLTEFVSACRREAETLRKGDADFASLVAQAGDLCERQKIHGTMLKAAEHLENNAPDQAMPPQMLAVSQLRDIYSMLNKWRAAEAQEKEKQLVEAVGDAKERLEKLTQLQSKVVEAIRQTLQQKDHSDKEMEEIEQEIDEVKETIEEALLKIATDLHIFPELPVGNDLVADVSQIYEEAKQVPGSAEAAATELGLQKEDWILDALEAATERVDDMEMWLMSQPDNLKRLTENFDKQEQPTIPVIPMASELQDIIGDLLEQQEDIKDQSDDSATNQGTSDFPAGWGIADGEFVNYSAKGKSGNEAPDHKEQDGRSLVGREGMANGETAAGSGKINQGDDNIEARRTQDSAQSGEVQEEGHAQAKATGGGKMGGYSDQLGMAGTGPRRDTNTSKGSMAGLQAMLRRNAEALYARASMMHIRTGALDEAVRHMQMAEEAMEKGYPIREVREHQRRAIAALKKSQTELDGAAAMQNVETRGTREVMEDQITGAADDAPAQYRELVSEYFKSLSEGQP